MTWQTFPCVRLRDSLRESLPNCRVAKEETSNLKAHRSHSLCFISADFFIFCQLFMINVSAKITHWFAGNKLRLYMGIEEGVVISVL
uniref:Uncharacterized protein n=1 Tax=Arion vulgaris TaxID=1028688 RepID=A0A0B7B7Z7_9EUPU